MAYANCGAYDSNGQRFPTKKALKAALLADPGSVKFDRTSVLDDGGLILGDDIPEGVTLSVVGPDPFMSRKYYALVENRDGKPVLK